MSQSRTSQVPFPWLVQGQLKWGGLRICQTPRLLRRSPFPHSHHSHTIIVEDLLIQILSFWNRVLEGPSLAKGPLHI